MQKSSSGVSSDVWGLLGAPFSDLGRSSGPNSHHIFIGCDIPYKTTCLYHLTCPPPNQKARCHFYSHFSDDKTEASTPEHVSHVASKNNPNQYPNFKSFCPISPAHTHTHTHIMRYSFSKNERMVHAPRSRITWETCLK